MPRAFRPSLVTREASPPRRKGLIATFRELFGSAANNAARSTSGAAVYLGWGAGYSAFAWTLERISQAVYLSNPTGYRCVELRVDNFSRPDWQVTKLNSDEAIDNSPIKKLLDNPWPKVSGTQMQRFIERDLSLLGRSVWLKWRLNADGSARRNGPINGLRRLHPARCTVIGGIDDELIGFVYRDRAGQIMPLLPEDVVYLHFPHPDRDYDSLPPALLAGLPAETDSGASRFNFDLLNNDGGLPGYMVIKDMSKADFDQWKAEWESRENPGKMRFMSGEAEYVRVGLTNEEMAYKDMRDMSRSDMCRAFGVPEPLLDPTDTTFTNMGEARATFITQTMQSQWVLVGDQITAQLADDFGGGVRIGFDLSELDELTDAEDAVIDRGVKLLDRKVLTINEFRTRDLKLDPVPWGDVPTAPLAPMKPQPIDPATGQPAEEDEEPEPEPPVPPKKPKSLDDEIADLFVQVKSAALASRSARVPERLILAYEGRAQRKMQGFFERQGRVVGARVSALDGKSRTVSVTKDDDRGPESTVQREADAVISSQRWKDELQQDVDDLLTDLSDAVGTDVASQLGAAFDGSAQTVRDFIMARAGKVSTLVNDTTASEVASLLADMEQQGASIPQMASALKDYFTSDDGRGYQRAELFARTECVGAANAAGRFAAQQSGVVTEREWMAAGDDRVDDECSALDGTRAAIDGQYQGDAEPGYVHPGCRCTETYITVDTGDES